MFTCCCLISAQHRYFRFSFIFISHCLNFHFIREQWNLNTTTGCCERDSLHHGVSLHSSCALAGTPTERVNFSNNALTSFLFSLYYIHFPHFMFFFHFAFLFFFSRKMHPKMLQFIILAMKRTKKNENKYFSFTSSVVSSPAPHHQHHPMSTYCHNNKFSSRISAWWWKLQIFFLLQS